VNCTIHAALYRCQWQAAVNTAMNLTLEFHIMLDKQLLSSQALVFMDWWKK
jgi:hypothetical protein